MINILCNHNNMVLKWKHNQKETMLTSQTVQNSVLKFISQKIHHCQYSPGMNLHAMYGRTVQF